MMHYFQAEPTKITASNPITSSKDLKALPKLMKPSPATITYTDKTGNASRQRCLQAKEKKASNSPTFNIPVFKEQAIVTRPFSKTHHKSHQNTITKGHHTHIATHTTNLYNTKQLPTVSLAMSPQDRAELPARAFWTANTVVESETGALLEYKDLKIRPDSGGMDPRSLERNGKTH